MTQSESWGKYPAPHYDEDDVCQCPDHVAMRQARAAERTDRVLLDKFLWTSSNIAWWRDEHEACERNTPGCSVAHRGDEECQT